jgi:hypothetical protein
LFGGFFFFLAGLHPPAWDVASDIVCFMLNRARETSTRSARESTSSWSIYVRISLMFHVRTSKEHTANCHEEVRSMPRHLRKRGRQSCMPPALSEMAWHWFKPQPQHNHRCDERNEWRKIELIQIDGRWRSRWRRRQRLWVWSWKDRGKVGQAMGADVFSIFYLLTKK